MSEALFDQTCTLLRECQKNVEMLAGLPDLNDMKGGQTGTIAALKYKKRLADISFQVAKAQNDLLKAGQATGK